MNQLTSAPIATRLPPGRYGLRGAVAMEWAKLRSLRSTWWILAVTLAGMIVLAIVVLQAASGEWAHMSAADRAAYDPTEEGFVGVALAQLTMAVLGALAMTSEYTSGTIHATLAAVPRRRVVLAAKAIVIGGMALVTGQIAAFAAFGAGEAAVRRPVPPASLGDPAVWRAVILTGCYFALIALIGLGLGAILRRSVAAVAVMVGLIYVVPPILLALPSGAQNAVEKFLPEIIAENSLAAVKPVADSLSAWAGLGVLVLYAGLALAAGGWLLARRDA